MRKQEDKITISRRSFLSRSTCASLGIGSMVHTLANLRVIDAFANSIVLSDYKALVCLFLRGGLDMNNVFIPIAGNPQAGSYITDRGVVAVPQAAIDAINPLTGHNTRINPAGQPANQWGLHPNCPHMADMFNAGELAFVHNVGTLAVPINTPAEYAAASKPNQLFSHSDQVTQHMMGSLTDQPFTGGWGGKVSNFVNSLNTQGKASMLITIAGNNDFLVSPAGGAPQYSVTTNGAIALVGYGPSTNPYGSALTDPGNPTSYNTSSTGRRLKAFQDIMNYTHDHIMEEGYNVIVRRARENEALVGEAVAVANNLQALGQVDFNGNFSGLAANNVGNELKMVAQLIAGRKCLGNERQIFFVDLGGFDTHQNINSDLPDLMDQVDSACHAFNQTMKQLAAAPADPDFTYNDFLCFEASDFNRTWTPNGNNINTSGTDHAWGSHMFCFGGPVKAQHAGASKMYGSFPTLDVGGPDDVPQGSRGRWIPSTSLDQVYSVIAEWFGVAPGDLNAVFPYRTRFETDPVAANVDFLDVTA